ncbi:quinol monooxygenase YgiN [Janthinobacterium sp. CG_23.3]|uniref:putative quinol monooxygenase n=1 Tax=unclassified Janthinobacterium TaxID=2610881 RepID=UPI00034DBBFC|nr:MULTISPECIES: antibiotic biosynthesis monooxygenase family protein [unclassified Janthinobacterium]MEC5159184.1 quinol monooxygenase YgiN [Janthinobacterium sp. CG_S6]
MSGIHVIVTFQTKAEAAAGFSALLAQVQRDLPEVEGCRGVQVFAGAGDPCLFTLLEEWDSAALHQAHIGRVVASGAWAGIAAQLAAEPLSHYCVRR